jgi:glucan phosphoethanolaminetransferase (alkaline phosphatase superfamily)
MMTAVPSAHVGTRLERVKWLFLLTLAVCYVAVLVIVDGEDGARAVAIVGTSLAVVVAVLVLGVVLGRFWVFIGAAVLTVLAGINAVVTVVEWWGTPTRACGPGCVEVANPWNKEVLGLAYIAFWFALGAIFVYLAIRAWRRRVTTC